MPRFRYLRFWITNSALLLHLACFADEPQPFGGPLPIRNARVYNLLFLQFQPESPEILRAGTRSFGFQLDLINNLLAPSRQDGVAVVEDNEYQRATVSMRRGLSTGWEAAVFVPLMWRNAGILDEIIARWHQMLGMGTNASQYDPRGRDARPAYKSVLVLTDSMGTPLVRSGNAFGLGDASVTMKRSLWSKSRLSTSMRAGIKLPSGNAGLILGSGSVDSGLILDTRYVAGSKFAFYGGLGRIWMGRPTRVPNARSSMWQWHTIMELRPNSRDSYVIQLDGSDAPVRTGNRFADEGQITLTIGYQRLLDRGRSIFISFSENGDLFGYRTGTVYVGGVGPDVTLTGGIRVRM